jgi:hypothetical protein
MLSEGKRLVNQDYRDLFRIFNAHHVRYLVVGAYAVIYYAEPRYTKDLDIWVEPTQKNAGGVWNALIEFGAPLEGVTQEDFFDEELIYQIGVAPNRVDVMMHIPGLEFPKAWARKATSTYGGEAINILHIDDLIHAKKTTDREEDRMDVKRLEEAKAARR